MGLVVVNHYEHNTAGLLLWMNKPKPSFSLSWISPPTLPISGGIE
jgi:hypothetical protein